MFDFRLWLTDWFEKKHLLHEKEKAIYFSERQVWMIHLGVNIGHEQNGGKQFLRPALILKKWSAETALVIPLSTKAKDIPLRIPVSLLTKNPKPSYLLLDQLRTIDVKRLSHKIGMVSMEDFSALRETLKRHI